MNDERFPRGEASEPRTQQASPPESSHVFYLRLLTRYTAGVLTLGRYLTNPSERPDYVLRRHGCPPMPLESWLEAGSWSVTEITRGEADRWEPPAHDDVCEQLLVLSDPTGNILLQNYGTDEEASRVEATLQRALKERLKAHGDAFTGRCPRRLSIITR